MEILYLSVYISKQRGVCVCMLCVCVGGGGGGAQLCVIKHIRAVLGIHVCNCEYVWYTLYK